MALAVGAGLLLALARMYAVAPLRWFASSYIEVVRGTPLLIQLYLIYYGLPNIGIRLSAFVADPEEAMPTRVTATQKTTMARL